MSAVTDKLVVMFSGPLAEDLKFGGANDRGDLRQIESLAAKYYVRDEDIEAARTRARQLVVSNWQKIEFVAAALLARKTLTGREIDDIMILSEV